ncbi:carbamoyltransferase HypF [Aestuariivirga sp.]|uniref:carbamoyltransferase HypF n=1 Tax=Aestuariivirga sp. TaxID=2650926 RepID=UPI0035B132B3
MAYRIRITGTVQGVGFRPFVWRLARDLGVRGQVLNDGRGVEIIAWCDDVDHFVQRLRAEAPPLARISGIDVENAEAGPSPTIFKIVESHGGQVATAIASDAATCPDCLAEIRDPAQRRFGHAFANCTNCGPRLSILRRLPYDRANTAMSVFEMCTACAAEYVDPADRRFHAQPLACLDCGPRLWLEEGMSRCDGIAAIDRAAELIRNGGIVAIKGLGGFHLAADARQEAAVARLRRGKQRMSKPFALMARDTAELERYSTLQNAEKCLVAAASAPILLLPHGPLARSLAPSVAPGQVSLGFMLPYTPLHHLLMARLDGPIVLTSGNVTDEPQCTGNGEARQRLGPLCDGLLLHDRDILQRVDDSVMRMAVSGPVVLRRARGLAPEPIALQISDAPPVLGLGGDLKAAVGLLAGGQLTVSQHLGDLTTPLAREDFEKMIDLLLELNDTRPSVIACDLHPEFHSTRVAHDLAARLSIPVMAVQHHHAHVLSCLADNGVSDLERTVLGIVLDGMGLGPDGSIWGGEFLAVDSDGSRRIGSIPVVSLPGGDAAARQPWRNAVAQLDVAFGWEQAAKRMAGNPVMAMPVDGLRRVLKLSQTPKTSSAGRLFDAVAALLGLCVERQDYEGEAASLLEACALQAQEGGDYGDGESTEGMTWQPLFSGILDDLADGTPRETIARRFHDTFISSVVRHAAILCNARNIDRVALSGGCFNNVLLLDGIAAGLAGQGLGVLVHRSLPPGDGGLAAGQCLAAALARGRVLH